MFPAITIPVLTPMCTSRGWPSFSIQRRLNFWRFSRMAIVARSAFSASSSSAIGAPKTAMMPVPDELVDHAFILVNRQGEFLETVVDEAGNVLGVKPSRRERVKAGNVRKNDRDLSAFALDLPCGARLVGQLFRDIALELLRAGASGDGTGFGWAASFCSARRESSCVRRALRVTSIMASPRVGRSVSWALMAERSWAICSSMEGKDTSLFTDHKNVRLMGLTLNQHFSGAARFQGNSGWAQGAKDCPGESAAVLWKKDARRPFGEFISTR